MTPRRETVLLRHETPDGGYHYDWLLDLTGEGPVRTFRTTARPDVASAGFDAMPMGEHRRVYLRFEGDVSDGRGRVWRVARGWIREAEVGDGLLRVRVDFGVGCVRWRGENGKLAWRFERDPTDFPGVGGTKDERVE